jgi:hypothetical protein
VTPEKTGSLIGAVGGLVLVEASSGAFGSGVALVLRGAGLVGFLAVLRALSLVQRPAPVEARRPGAVPRGLSLVVAAEVLALVVGVRVLAGPLDTPQAVLPWIAFVVGTHFVALALVLHQRVLARVGYGMTACGAVALPAAFLGASDPVIAALAGIVPGALLLAGSLWSVEGRRVVTVA